MEFRERWAPLGGDDYRRKFSQLSQFFQLAAIFQRRDGARGALRNERGFVSPCLLDSTLLYDSVLTTLPRILGKSSDVMKVLVARAQSSLFRESVGTRRPFFPSTITFPSLMGHIVRAVSWRATKRGKCVSVTRWRLLPFFDRWFTSLGKKPKKLKLCEYFWNYALSSLLRLVLQTHLFFSPIWYLFFSIFPLSGFWQRYICRLFRFAQKVS